MHPVKVHSSTRTYFWNHFFKEKSVVKINICMELYNEEKKIPVVLMIVEDNAVIGSNWWSQDTLSIISEIRLSTIFQRKNLWEILSIDGLIWHEHSVTIESFVVACQDSFGNHSNIAGSHCRYLFVNLVLHKVRGKKHKVKIRLTRNDLASLHH